MVLPFPPIVIYELTMKAIGYHTKSMTISTKTKLNGNDGAENHFP